jgi:hypothetical protein
MGWNYRVMRHTKAATVGGGADETYAIHEVYYRSDDVDDLTLKAGEFSCTVDPVSLSAENMADLRSTLQEMLKALDKPILEYLQKG